MTGWVVATETIEWAGMFSAPLEPADEPYAIIPLHGKYGEGLVTKVSLKDVARVRRYRWYVTPDGYVYAYEHWKKGKPMEVIKLHRFVLGLAKDDTRWGDHKFGDKLDNRQTMLRACTPQQNTCNRRVQQRNKAGFKGVYFNKGIWEASIMVHGELHLLGRYATDKEAARVYDKAARYHFGEFAHTNFPGTEAKSATSIREKYIAVLRAKYTSPFIGVTFRFISLKTGKPVWRARIGEGFDRHQLGDYDSEEDAARAYDLAARYLFGPTAETNFPGTEAKSPDEVYKEYGQPVRSSTYIGVDVDKGGYRARIRVGSPYTEHLLGNYRLEEDAARAFDAAARFFYGADAVTNFEGTEALSPEEIKAGRDLRRFHPNARSKYVGVSWKKVRRGGMRYLSGSFWAYLSMKRPPLEPLMTRASLTGCRG